jgi:hypothetical protein
MMAIHDLGHNPATDIAKAFSIMLQYHQLVLCNLLRSLEKQANAMTNLVSARCLKNS